jgi:Primase X
VRNIKDTLGVSPSIIWSGGGVHLYLPVEAFVLEDESEFNKYGNPSRKFIQFAEQYLSNQKADLQHSRGLSFNNCMLRVPGSINSKYSTEVIILQRWDGNRPKIKPLLFRFDLYLLVLKANELQEAKKLDKKRSKYINTKTQDDYIDWIETLLDTSISDYRKYAVWRILAHYLITIKKLSYQDSFNIIKEWLDKCNSTARLQGWSGRRIREYLDNAAQKGYFPISLDKLKIENRPLYDLIRREYSR